MQIIFYNADKVFFFEDAAFIAEYTPTSVKIIKDAGGVQVVNFPAAMEVLKTDLVSAYDLLISQGVACALLETELGILPASRVGFHVQEIAPITASDGRALYREVDLQTMPILPTISRIRTVWKVKHYYDAALLEYAGAEFPDTVRTLVANNYVRIPLPDGSTIGEYDAFAGPVMRGDTTNIKQQLAHTVTTRAAEGRFD